MYTPGADDTALLRRGAELRKVSGTYSSVQRCHVHRTPPSNFSVQYVGDCETGNNCAVTAGFVRPDGVKVEVAVEGRVILQHFGGSETL